MIWEELSTSDAAAEWYANVIRDRPPPPAFSVEASNLTYADAFQTVRQRGLIARIWPGGMEIEAEGVPPSEAEPLIIHQVEEIIYSIDERRRVYRWEDLDDEEYPPPHVMDEIATEISGMRAVGPGGRALVLRLGESVRASVSIRRTLDEVSGTWVPPTTMATRFNQLMDVPSEDIRVRAAFGYHELSLYSEQRLIRPAVVVIIDRVRALDGPQWRVVYVEPATYGDNGLAVGPGASYGDPGAAGIGDPCQ